MNSAATASAWVLAFRPKTLTAALVPVVVATGLVRAENTRVQMWISIFAVLSALFIQIGTNLINDALDFKKGADNEDRIGPKRATQSGMISEQRVLRAGYFCFAVAAALGLPLVMQGGWLIVSVGVLSLLCGYIYTGGPYPLAYKGLGDLFVIIFFGLVAVGGVYFLHTHRLTTSIWIAGLQIGFLATVMIALNNLRDRRGDARVGKSTLAVRFGERFAKAEIAVLSLVPFGLGFFWVLHGRWLAFVLPILALPLAFSLVRAVYRTPPSPAYNQFLARASLVHMLFGLLLTIGLVW